MATKQQIDHFLKMFQQTKSSHFFRGVDETRDGMGAVMRLLAESEEVVTAGYISQTLSISTARVAVLLKKLVAKGLVEKNSSDFDARVTVVTLTPFGKQFSEQITEHLRSQIAHAIDTVGEARLNDMFETLALLHSQFTPPKHNFRPPFC